MQNRLRTCRIFLRGRNRFDLAQPRLLAFAAICLTLCLHVAMLPEFALAGGPAKPAAADAGKKTAVAAEVDKHAQLTFATPEAERLARAIEKAYADLKTYHAASFIVINFSDIPDSGSIMLNGYIVARGFRIADREIEQHGVMTMGNDYHLLISGDRLLFRNNLLEQDYLDAPLPEGFQYRDLQQLVKQMSPTGGEAYVPLLALDFALLHNPSLQTLVPDAVVSILEPGDDDEMLSMRRDETPMARLPDEDAQEENGPKLIGLKLMTQKQTMKLAIDPESHLIKAARFRVPDDMLTGADLTPMEAGFIITGIVNAPKPADQPSPLEFEQQEMRSVADIGAMEKQYQAAAIERVRQQLSTYEEMLAQAQQMSEAIPQQQKLIAEKLKTAEGDEAEELRAQQAQLDLQAASLKQGIPKLKALVEAARQLPAPVAD